MSKTFVYKKEHRPAVQTHIYFMIDAFIEFLLSDLSPERSYTILTNHYCIPVGPGPFILFNIEQLTRPKILDEVYKRAIQSDIVEVWDYSPVNVRLLQSRGIAAKYVPVQTPLEIIQTLQSYIPPVPMYDIGFCGVAPERRMKLIQQLAAKGLKVLLLHGTYMKDRDRMLASCKIHLNIHQTDDHKVFEIIRCDPWLKAGIPILSEHSLEDDPRCINVSYDTLVETAFALCRSTS